MTFVAALRCERIEAPCLFDGSVNGESFLAFRRRPGEGSTSYRGRYPGLSGRTGVWRQRCRRI